MTHLDPYESATAGLGLSHDLAVLIREVIAQRKAVETIADALLAVCEGYELPAADEAALRNQFAGHEATDGRRIVTKYAPPVPPLYCTNPTRSKDWSAWFADDDEEARSIGNAPTGHGATELEAIADLMLEAAVREVTA